MIYIVKYYVVEYSFTLHEHKYHDWFNEKIKLPIARQDFQGRKNAGEKGREARQLQNESETQNGIEVKNHTVELG